MKKNQIVRQTRSTPASRLGPHLDENVIESFRCSIRSIDGNMIEIDTLSSEQEEGVAWIKTRHIPPRYLFPNVEFVINVLGKGKYAFHFEDTDVQFEQSAHEVVDVSFFASKQPELAFWLTEIFQGTPDYSTELLAGMSRQIFRVKFQSRAFHYILLSSKIGEKKGVLTCTAIPKWPRPGESKSGYEISGGAYDVASWNKITQKIAALETLRSISFEKSTPQRDYRTL